MAGLDQIDSLVALRSQHEVGVKNSGLDTDTGGSKMEGANVSPLIT